jgi:signal peptidase II
MSVSSTTRDARPWALLLTLLVIVADRLSKLWVVAHIPAGNTITVVPGVFRISHVLNTGAAFSLFEGAKNPNTVRYALIGFSLVAVAAVFFMLWRTGRSLTVSTVAFALILGGAMGNLYDRIHLHYVVDFLEVRIVHYHYPDFNLADSAIVIGACLLLLEAFRPQPRT